MVVHCWDIHPLKLMKHSPMLSIPSPNFPSPSQSRAAGPMNTYHIVAVFVYSPRLGASEMFGREPTRGLEEHCDVPCRVWGGVHAEN